MAYFQVYKDKSNEWRWRLKANNHEPIANSGEGYQSKASCLHGIEVVKKLAEEAELEEA